MQGKNDENMVIKNSNCCGCEVCVQICPQAAIVMAQNEEGFFYPEVDKEKCILCGMCAQVCPMQERSIVAVEPIIFGIKNKDLDKRLKESSGGFFSVLCEFIRSKDGIIYGVKWKEGKQKAVEYGRVESNNYEVFQGSKYLQSKKNGIYVHVGEDLNNDRWVLFTGTPCDNDALKKYLELRKVKTDKLLSVDVVCGGAASPKFFSEYINFLEKVYDSEVEEYNFRDKSNDGWLRFGVNAKFGRDIEYQVPSLKDFYFSLFDNNYISRPACYRCQWAKSDRLTDFTLGDFWGINEIDPDFFDEAGVSLVLVNTEKANNVFNEVRDKINYRMYEKEFVIRSNSCLEAPIVCPENRDKIWMSYRKNGFAGLLKENWLPWKIVDRTVEKFRIKNTVMDLSVNRNWIIPKLQQERKELEVIGVYVDRESLDYSIYVKPTDSRQKESPVVFDTCFFVDKDLGLLRLELEGLEDIFLDKLEAVILRDRPIILAELMRKWAAKYGYHPNDILLKLSRWGYKCYAISDKFSVQLVDEITNVMSERWYLFVFGL